MEINDDQINAVMELGKEFVAASTLVTQKVVSLVVAETKGC